ncbi:hypothetical protein SAMN05444483_11262 [Salegentibacter echinorum]|uniref:Methyltransferase domain-containing protein n=1 Tax=Salegentibacter echinorum TaxID=1073325 RepID=A0A1M5JWB5_SALEC|nr:hypothetical protein [Salegentibacter echinorum]SHG44695.1 hypothetical protein SAMN05444483_11262 [Salegentibacter echinorum]
MSLKLKLKTSFFKILDKLPPKIGYAMYHQTQQLLGSSSLQKKLKSNLNSYRLLKKICKKIGFSLRAKTVLEIGSGWVPAMPYFMLYLGKARAVATYDLNLHYNKRNIRGFNALFTSEFGIPVAAAANSRYALPESVAYYPKTNLISSELPEVDVVFSRFVLEHVIPQDLKLMHKKFKNELKEGTYIIHLISPSDHRAYVDKNLSLQDFLQYSEAEWQQKQTKFDYHNRLRLPEYLSIFEAAGLEVTHLDYSTPNKNSAVYKKFKALQLHKDYTHFTDKELTAGAINVVLKV